MFNISVAQSVIRKRIQQESSSFKCSGTTPFWFTLFINSEEVAYWFHLQGVSSPLLDCLHPEDRGSKLNNVGNYSYFRNDTASCSRKPDHKKRWDNLKSRNAQSSHRATDSHEGFCNTTELLVPLEPRRTTANIRVLSRHNESDVTEVEYADSIFQQSNWMQYKE